MSDSEGGDHPEVQALAGTIRALKGHLTRKISSAKKALADAGARPSSHALQELLEYQEAIKAQYGKIETAYTKIMELDDDDNYEDYDKELDIESKRADEAVSNIRRVVSSADSAPAPSTSAAPSGQGDRKVKPNKALEPPKLTREHTTVELRSWIKKFKAWYASSQMSNASIQEQQAYFRMVIDVNLETKLSADMQEDTPIFGKGSQISCMRLLLEEFLLQYPLLSRQVDFFESKQQKDQIFSDWTAQLRALGNEADLSNFSTEDIYIMRYLTGTRDDKLREKFLKEPKPTLKLFDKIAHQHEIAASSIKAMTAQRTDTRLVGQKRQQRRVPTTKELLEQKKCIRCGVPGHTANNCYHKEAVCHGCQGKGHLKRVCQNSQKEKRPMPTKARAVTGDDKEAPEAPPEYRSDDDSDKDDKAEKGTVNQVIIRQCNITSDQTTPRMNVRINELFSMNACADTGTTRSIISKDVCVKHGLKIYKARERLFAANGERMACEGRTPLRLKYHGFTTPIMALVSSSMTNDMLISWKDLREMQVLPSSFPQALVRQIVHEDMAVLRSSLISKYPDVFNDKLSVQPMAGPPMEIHLTEGATPTRCHTARSVPLHWKEPAEQAVQQLVESGILIHETGPTDWISPGFFVPKGDPLAKTTLKKGMVVVTLKDLRLVVDYTGLNRFVKRPVHPFPSTKDIIQQLPADGRVFATLDAVQGYHQIALSEESSKLTTFLLPSGRYRFLRAPMGLSASSDEWCCRSDEVISGIKGVQKIVDDILISAPDLETLRLRIRKVLDRCKKENVTISCKKFQVSSKVKFAGHIISSEGVAPDPERIRAIADYKSPCSTKDVRGFLGLANQLASFHPDLSHMTVNLRNLLKKGIAFQWLKEHQEEFEKVKKLLTSPSIVSVFDRQRETLLLTDASKKQGLGFALLQKDAEGRPHLIQCGSRTLTAAEENWATIELEAKAIEYGMMKCRHYLMGHPRFTVVTDHRPLVSIFSRNMDDTLNSRILRIRERIANFSFDIIWQPGKVHCIADALSRTPVFSANEEDEEECGDDETVRMVVATDPNLRKLMQAAEHDNEYQEQLKAVADDNLDKLSLTHPMQGLKSMWDQLSIMDGQLIVVNGSRILVPSAARKDLLMKGHESHCGASKMKAQFRQLYYWPGMSNDIENIVRGCQQCRYHQPSQQKEPLQPTMATRPMQRMGVDIFESGGKHYLSMIDRFSGFPFAACLPSMTTAAVTKELLRIFMDFGFAEIIRTDNGPAFRQEFKKFCEVHGIVHETSSPHFPQSNGHAECGVKICKQLLQKCEHQWGRFKASLLEWRNVKRPGGFSPAQLMFGKAQKTSLPMLPGAFQPIDGEAAVLDRENRDKAMKKAYDSDANILPELQVGDSVVVQDVTSRKWNREGRIKDIVGNGNSYIIEFQDGGHDMRRNRRFIRAI